MSALSCRTISRARSCLARARVESKGRSISPTSRASQRCPLTVDTKATAHLETLDSQAARALSLAAVSLVTVVGSAHAGEAVPEGLTDVLNSWLDGLEALGPLGPAAFVITIGICECIPFFPTQPLSICAGLLFGAGSGAALNLLGMSIAATIAFTLSRTAGRGLAQAVINAEVGEEEGKSDNKGIRNPVAEQIEKAQIAIESGGPLKQFTAILLLRLTPVVPFSASNYVLGLTPVPYGPFIGATVAGMSVWAVLLASLGGAGRGLVSSGENLADAIAQVSSGAGEMTGWVLAIALSVGLGALTLNAVAPTILPDPEDLGKPEAEAEAKRQAHLAAAAQKQPLGVQQKSDDDQERDRVLAAAQSSRKGD